MFVCKNCNAAYDEPSNFCAQCGGTVEEVVPAVQEDVANEAPQAEVVNEMPQEEVKVETPVATAQPVSQQPEQPVVAESGVGSKVMGIISMVLGIFGVFFGFICFIGTFAAIIEDGRYADETLSQFLGLSFFMIGSSIAALILSGKANSGAVSNGMATAGKITGIIGVIMNAIALFFSFMFLMMFNIF